MNNIDHSELALKRLATEFRESKNLISYILTLIKENQSLEQIFQDLIFRRSIDLSTGKTLDIIGSIVGQSREFIDAEVFDYFGFQSNPQSQSFGSVVSPALGGRFRAVDEITQGLRLLSDEEYRTFIRARITRNNIRATPENIIEIIKFIFGAAQVIIEEGDTSYSVDIGVNLTLNQKAVLFQTDIVPKTAGVSVYYRSQYDSNSFFSFTGIPLSRGFGSINNPSLGGKFANLI